MRELFSILAQFFTVKAGSRTRAWEPDDEADPCGANDPDLEPQEQSEHEGENHEPHEPHEEPHEEPHGEPREEGEKHEGENHEPSDDGPRESQDVGGEAGKPEHPVTPKKDTPKNEVDDDPLDEFMAWKMGGESMVKPTPSPGNPWTSSKESVKDGQMDEIDDELERLEFLI